jgi:hypothetical protein
MKKKNGYILVLIAVFTLLPGLYYLLNGIILRDAKAQSACCNPPSLPPQAARFSQNATVNVYIDANSGFTATEQQMIIEGLQGWNNQPNNSRVSYNLTVTSTLPAAGTNNTIIVRYNDQYSSGTGGALLNMHQNSGSNGISIYGDMSFFRNIRVGDPTTLPSYVRETARHEGGHGVGLENAMMFAHREVQ